MNKKAIIVDDELKSREVLKNLIENFCTGVDIVSTADDIDTGIAAIEEHHPNLVFLDISLKTGDSFNIITRLKTLDFCCVFVTAYNEVSLPILQYCNIPCLLKPIDLDQLENTIDDCSNPPWEGLFKQKNEALKFLLGKENTILPVISEKQTLYLPHEQIIAVAWSAKGSTIYTKNGNITEGIHLPMHFAALLKGKLLFNNRLFVKDGIDFTLQDMGIKLSTGAVIYAEF